MPDILPDAYLLGLIGLLAIAAVAVGRQILRVRADELTLYELASVQLRKRLYDQAADTLKSALKQSQAEQAPAEALALMENAMGFALAAQNKYPAAIRHYRSAIKAKPDYPVALNNLAFALEKQGKVEESRQTYQEVLTQDPDNKTARKRLKSLDRRAGIPSNTAA
jgi:tetratricopeptide (TPR) repeat protein